MPVQAANEFAPDQINHGPNRHGAYPCPSDAAQARNLNMKSSGNISQPT